LRRNAEVAVLLAAVILLLSMTPTTEAGTVFTPLQNQLDTTLQFTLANPLVLGISSQQHTNLNQTTRANIYTLVENNPGIHFRGICDSLMLSVGMVQYHTGILVAAGFLSVYSDGKMQRFFMKGKYSTREMKIVSLLRHQTRGNILRIISKNGAVTHRELAQQLSITSQGLTWQIHRLEKEGVIKETENDKKLIYRINQENTTLVNELVSIVR
jgi:predicted transcriptional regulator